MRREEPTRRGPIRNPAIRSSNRFVRDAGGPAPAAPPQAPPTPGTAQGAVESTVATAYTVIEKYLSRGQSAASLHYGSNGDRNMNESGYPGAPPGWPPAYGRPTGGVPGSGFGSAGDPWGIGMWMEPWMQMMRMWSDSLNMLGGPAGMMNPLSTMMGASSPTGISVEVQSARPARVTVELAPGADAQQLSVGALRGTGDSSGSTLDNVDIFSRPGHCTVRLRVSDSQPPGVYVATVEDPQRRPLGELSVTITGAERKRSAAPPKKRESSASVKK